MLSRSRARGSRSRIPTPRSRAGAGIPSMPDAASGMLTVTPKAAVKVNQLLEKQGKAGGALRVRVVGGGCSGLQYKLDLEPAAAADDTVVESAGVRVLVDP